MGLSFTRTILENEIPLFYPVRWRGHRFAEEVIIRPASIYVRAGIGLVLACTLLVSAAPDEKRVAVYSIVANYSLPVVERNGQDYVGLLEALEPLGTVNAQGNGQRWKLLYNETDCEFTSGKTRARIKGRDFDLPANFLLENGRGLVPVASLGNLLPQILGGPVSFHENSRRLYIGSVGVHFTAQISPTSPTALVMNFTSPVNPRIATEPGKVQMVFSREPLIAPGTPTLTFDSKVIPSASFQESTNAVEIVVNTRAPLFASFTNNGRTITLSTSAEAKPAENSSAPAASTTTPGETPAPPPANTGAVPTTPSTGTPTTPTTSTSVFAVIDASHGGDERGATLSEQLSEKDVTLAFARRLKSEMEAKGLPALILRDGENSLTVEQRASFANQKRPKIYICLHASTLGSGVRLYTAMVPHGGQNSGSFLDWDTAQDSFLSLSQSAASSMQRELRSQSIAARMLMAPLRPLNNIAVPAIAVEITPPGGTADGLMLPDYQGKVAAALANGVATMRPQLEANQ